MSGCSVIRADHSKRSDCGFRSRLVSSEPDERNVMYTYLLADWTTVRGTGNNGVALPSEADWMSFQPYQDVIFWLDVRSVTAAGTTVTLEYQTAPAKEEALFRAMGTALSITAATTTPTVTPYILSTNPTVPLARFVRWKLLFTGTASGEWGACFRIHCAANAVGVLG